MKKLLIVAASTLPLMVGTAQADQVFLDDIIVDGSACIGMDCVNGESFGFDTIRIKENNLRIKFQDTSTTASFPGNDWQLTANDSANGGANKFSIDDIDGGRTPFTVEAGAPSNSLYVDDAGRVGLGTAAPVVELHVVNGDSPTLRLEQDGSSGFTPQTWDVAGNETNFFVRDATNGSALPFRIRASAPGDSLFIDTDGDIGLGTATPSTTLHVRRASSGSDVILTVENASATNGDHAELALNTDAQSWSLRSNTNNNSLTFVNATAGTAPIVFGSLAQTNLLRVGVTAADTINVTGNLVATGTVTPDYVFKPDYKLMSIDDHAQFMWQNSHLPKVKAAAVNDEGKPYINVVGRSQGMLEELEVAHIYIDQLNKQVKEKSEAISALEIRISKLENK